MATSASVQASTGIAGLDQLLGGGFPTRRMHLIEGVPGTGKTTLALQFLLAARDRGERTLYITLSETTEELGAVATSHGWSLDGIETYQLAPVPDRAAEEYTLYHPAEVELSDLTRAFSSAPIACSRRVWSSTRYPSSGCSLGTRFVIDVRCWG